ncbi:MAG: histidinol-phosphate transaminase [Rhodothermales bacterium]|nr:histidinol-phosphate transaminase [Rhodothermales bacterium]
MATSSSPIDRIRPQVRAEKQYTVKAHPGISCKLNQNESPFDVDDDLKQEILDEMLSVPFNRYPEDQPAPLIEAVASSLGCSPDSILVGNGSNELTHTLGLSLIAGGQNVVLPKPMFALFASVVRLFGGRLTSIPPRGDLSFDTDAIVEAIREEDPALTVIATPNNPTGLEMTRDEVVAILRAARGFVLVDEAYVEFGREPDALPLIEDYPNTIVMRTLSKGVGLAGLRVGFLVAHPDVIRELLKARLPFMIGEFAQRAAIRLLQRPDYVRSRVAAMQQGTQALGRALTELGVEHVPSSANFIIFKSPIGSRELFERVAGSGVLIRDMSGYPELEGYVRVCVGTADENKAFLTALKTALC